MKGHREYPAIAGWIVYALALCVVVAHHELGHFESQAWNIVRSATSLSNLLHMVGNEGHSPLGYLLMWPLSVFGQPLFMQWIGFGVGAFLAWRLIRDRPFPYPLIALVLMGYFFFYEYTVVPRTYLLALLGISLLASAIFRGTGSLLFRVALCCLVAASSSFGLILSGALFLTVLTIHWVPVHAMGLGSTISGVWTTIRLRPSWESVSALLLYTVVCILVILAIINPAVHSSFEQSLQGGTNLSLARYTLAIITPVFPHIEQMPLIGNSWFGPGAAGRPLLALGALAVLASVAFLFRRWPVVVFGYVSALVLMMGLASYAGFVVERVLGHIVLLALFLFWVRPALPGYSSAPTPLH